MKKLIVLFSLIIATSILSYGQNDHFILKKQNRNKQKIINSNERIKVITYSGLKVRGKFRVINDKSIAIGTDTIQLADIKKVRYKSRMGIVAGSLIGTSGTLGIVGGAGIIISSASEGAIAAIVGIIVGFPVIAVGTLVATTGILVATVGKAHKAKKWEYHAVKAY